MLKSLAKKRCPTLVAFREAVQKCQKPGKRVEAVVQRDGDGDAADYRTTLKVASKRQHLITDTPSLDTARDIAAVLKDPIKLQRIIAATFALVDADGSGLVSYTDFLAVMRSWLPPGASRFVTNDELRTLFNQFDGDEIGLLGCHDFPPLVHAMLQDVLHNMIEAPDAVTATLPGAEKPWVGFLVEKPQGKKRLTIQEIEEGGSAHLAGLEVGDEIVSINGVRITTYPLFQEVLQKELRFDAQLTFKIRRSARAYTTKLVVGKREVRTFKNIPKVETINQILDLLKDDQAFEVMAEHVFQQADTDCIGIVKHSDLAAALQLWSPFSTLITPAMLSTAMGLSDLDESGFLAKFQFPAFLHCIVQLAAKWYTIRSSPAMVVTTHKYITPVPTMQIHQAWHQDGLLCGTFRGNGHGHWLRNTNEDHWPHVFVSVLGELVVEKLNGELQTEVLQPGDELFIPAGTVYNAQMKDPNNDRFMFGLGVHHHRWMHAIDAPFLAQEITPTTPRHPWLGFLVEKDLEGGGVRVKAVAPQGPRGLAPGDLLVAVGGTPVSTPAGFQAICKALQPGQSLDLQVEQNGRVVSCAVAALGSRYNHFEHHPVAFTSIQDVDAALQNKKRIAQLARACLAAADGEGNGTVAREGCTAPLAAQLPIPPPLGGPLPEADLLKCFDQVDAGAAGYLTEGELQKFVAKVLEKVLANAIALEERLKPPPPEPEEPRKGSKKDKAGKPKKEARARAKASPSVGLSAQVSKVTKGTAKSKAQPKEKKRSPSIMEGAPVSPWATKKSSGVAVEVDLLGSGTVRMTPRSKAPAMQRTMPDPSD